MMKTLLLTLGLNSVLISAAHAAPDLGKFKLNKPSADGKSDDSRPLAFPDFSKVNNQPQKKNGIKFESSCKTSTGQSYSQGQDGFDGCLTEAQTGAGKQMMTKEEAARGAGHP